MSVLFYEQRLADGDAIGLLVLHHGRGTSEQDLLELADVLDPQRRLHIVAPRAPLSLPSNPGYQWYLVPSVGHPDPQTFREAGQILASFHDELHKRTGLSPQQTILGGFSMGTAMSYALGLAASRIAPAGVLALSGFIPEVGGWELDLTGRRDMPVFIAHGSSDPVIPVELARRAHTLLLDARLDVSYHEFGGGHYVDRSYIPAAVDWLSATISAERPAVG